MITFPNAKINLGLQIVEKLPNGYHAINSCLYPIPWSDVLEFVPSKKTQVVRTGIPVPGKPEEDIILKAYKRLKKDYSLPDLGIHLHKLVPIGAGLGGGSADAAFMLKLLNSEFQLFLDDEILEEYAAELGSDCPFFIKNSPALVTGTGTELAPIDLDLSGNHLLIINPRIHISTQEAYSGTTPHESKVDLKKLLVSKDFQSWKELLVNDFELSIFKKHSTLKKIKDQLYDQGASYAAMSGSGSTMFGIFQDKPDSITYSEGWITKTLEL